MTLRPLPDAFTVTSDTLPRVAAHGLARRQLCGKIGRRATPGGIGTPACGPDHEVLRISGTRLLRERGDSFSAQLYLYVGPWGSERPGDPDYGNAPFGAVLTYDRMMASPDPEAVAGAFLRRGITLLQARTAPTGAWDS